MHKHSGVQTLTRPATHACVTVGNFDGVHLGHRQLLDLTVEKAKARGGTAVAFTFRPHPRVALSPEVNHPLLTTYDEKAELIAAAGVGLLIEEPFSREFSQISPERFFNEILLSKLSAEAIVVGYDFGFGKGREGQLEKLKEMCRQTGVELTVVQPCKIAGEVVSSSRIRSHLLAGEIDEGNRLLGREFSCRGIVMRGDGRGCTIGFPTANLRPEEVKLALPNGVYATWAKVDGKIYPSVTNLGVRPTFRADPTEQPAPLIECHLFDQSLDLYGRAVEVRFVRKLREERKFAGIDELKQQIAIDAKAARDILV